MEDASPRDGFVTLRAEIIAVQLQDAWQPVEGGIAISINGAAAENRGGSGARADHRSADDVPPPDAIPE